MMRDSLKTACAVTVFTLAAGLCWQSDATAQSWPNEPAGATLLTECSFSSTSCSGWETVFAGQIVSDASAPVSPSSVLQHSIGPGQNNGGGQITYYFNNHRDIYIGYWAKFSNPLIQPSNQLQKVSVTWATGPCALLWHLLHGNPSETGPFFNIVQLESCAGLSNSHLPGWGDAVGSWNLSPNLSNPQVTQGVWHRFELHLKNSTTSASRDGVVEFWMDGIKTHEYGVNGRTGINYPDNWSHFEFTPAWTDWLQYGITITNRQWFDHVRLSTGGGSGGPPKADTTPPASPVNLRAQ